MPMKITNTILVTMYSMNLYNMMSEMTGLTSPSIYFDKYNLMMIFMVNMVFIMIGIKMGSSKQSSKMMCLLFLLLIIFSYMFVTMNFYVFYIMFEFSVVPLLYFISAWGYSLERVKSMFYMFLYTFSFSLPFFLLMMYTSKDGIYNMIHGLSQNVSLNPYILFLMMMLFLVKMPLWGMHMWLTKAHVDASTEGSMILAGVVLKLCGMGLMKFYFLYEFQLFSKIMNFFLCLSLMGSIFLSFFIMRQTDLKMMVALSSIVHMCLMLILWIFSSSFSSYTLIVVMVAHGIISPLMFMFLGLLYESLSTRTLYMAKGALSCLKYINILWFLVVIFNMGMPLTMNFLGELFFFINSLMYSKFILITAGVLVLGNGLFSMYLYTLLNSGENNHMSKMKMNTEDILLFYYGLLFVMVALLFF